MNWRIPVILLAVALVLTACGASAAPVAPAETNIAAVRNFAANGDSFEITPIDTGDAAISVWHKGPNDPVPNLVAVYAVPKPLVETLNNLQGKDLCVEYATTLGIHTAVKIWEAPDIMTTCKGQSG